MRFMSAAQNRFQQADAPLGGSDDTQCATWGLVVV